MMKPILKSLYQNSRNEEIKNLIFNAFSDDYCECMKIVQNPKTPISILEKLSNDEHYYVREWVAENKNAPIHILEKLSNDEEELVRYNVAQNPNTPIHILEKLSNDKDLLVWEYVYKNPNWIKSRK